MQCRTHAAQLGRFEPQFKAAGTQVLAILGEPIVRGQS